MAFVANPWSGAQRALLHVLTGGASAGLPAAPPAGGAPGGGWLDLLSTTGDGVGGPALSPGGVPPSQGGTGTGSLPPGAQGPPAGGGSYAPFGQPGTDSPPAWLAQRALAAYQSGNTAYFAHLLADPTISGNQHLRNFILGLQQGDPARVKEAQYYAGNPSYNGWNNAAGDGIPGDGR